MGKVIATLHRHYAEWAPKQEGWTLSIVHVTLGVAYATQPTPKQSGNRFRFGVNAAIVGVMSHEVAFQGVRSTGIICSFAA